MNPAINCQLLLGIGASQVLLLLLCIIFVPHPLCVCVRVRCSACNVCVTLTVHHVCECDRSVDSLIRYGATATSGRLPAVSM